MVNSFQGHHHPRKSLKPPNLETNPPTNSNEIQNTPKQDIILGPIAQSKKASKKCLFLGANHKFWYTVLPRYLESLAVVEARDGSG